MTLDGKLFQTRGTATKKARSPIVERRDDSVTRADVDAERSRLLASMSATRHSSFALCMVKTLQHYRLHMPPAMRDPEWLWVYRPPTQHDDSGNDIFFGQHIFKNCGKKTSRECPQYRFCPARASTCITYRLRLYSIM